MYGEANYFNILNTAKQNKKKVIYEKRVMPMRKKTRVKRGIIIFLFVVNYIPYISAQKICLKNNLIHDAVLIPNLSAEWTLSDKLSIDLNAAYNPFQFSDTKKWKLIAFRPEIRFWTFKKYAGAFWGVHVGYKFFNMGGIGIDIPSFGDLSSSRVQGSMYDAGITFGHQWILSPRWGIEAFLGVGYAKSVYDEYVCVKCGEKSGRYNDDYFGPTKTGISLVYMLK